MYGRIIAGIAAAALLAGCSSTTSGHQATQAASTPPASTASSAPAVATTTAPAAKPLSYYAAQYTRITAGPNAAGKAFSASATQQTADTFRVAIQTADAQLLRAQWPSTKVAADVEALVRADGTIIGDLADLSSNSNQLVRDSGSLNALANIVRADLGLPPATS